jgi:hypothetical protein
MKEVQCGLFKLPGLSFKSHEISQALLSEMKDWSTANKTGMYMNDNLWSFKNEEQRTWFVLRWNDAIVAENRDDV